MNKPVTLHVQSAECVATLNRDDTVVELRIFGGPQGGDGLAGSFEFSIHEWSKLITTKHHGKGTARWIG